MRAPRHRDVVLALSIVLAALTGMPATATARTASTVSLAVPASVPSGARLAAVGTAQRAPRDTRVVLQRRKAGRWATLGRSRLVRGRFRFAFKAPASSTALTLTVRAILVRGRRQLKRSPTRRIAVRAAARIGAPVRPPPATLPPPANRPAEPEVAVTAPAVRMTPGSTAEAITPAPLTSITALEPGPTGAALGVSLRAAQGRVVVAAARQSVLGETTPTLHGTGCTASECGRRFVMRVPITVLPTLAPMSWSDEFDGSELDLTRWSYRASGPRFDAVVTPEAVSVGDGALTIKTYTAEGEHYVGMIGSYLHETGGFEQTYGYFEARMKFDNAPGQWSAFWLQSPTLGRPLGDPATAGVEMDIAEHRTQCVEAPAPTPPQTCSPTSDISNRIQQALIWDGYGAESKSAVKLSEPLAGLGNGSWHTWAMRWTPTDVTFYYDGVPTWSQTEPISRRDEYMILSSDVGEFFAGAIPAGGYGSRATTTTKTQVDYVRVWPLG